MDINALLKTTVDLLASDLHITTGLPPVVRKNGELVKLDGDSLSLDNTKKMVGQLLSEKQFYELERKGEIDLSYSINGVGRFRINVFKQKGALSIASRTVAHIVPSINQLGLPNVIKDLSLKQRGLILVTGPTGSGKSTTLAAMIDFINKEKSCHILTLEDPIEYVHRHNKSMINQREIGSDSNSFVNALRAGLRQDPDVILIGEMRDIDTMSIAITAAETGHLVLSTLHTVGAAKTIDRIIDVFPTHQQQQIRTQLSSVLEGVISQQLLKRADKDGRIAAFEIMVANGAIRNLIREGKIHQIQNSIQTGTKYGMCTMDNSLIDLFNKGYVTKKEAITYSVNQEAVKKIIGY